MASLKGELSVAEEKLGVLRAQATGAYQQWRTADTKMGEQADRVIGLRRKISEERNRVFREQR